MALIGFGYHIVQYELALISFSHALVNSGSLIVRHRVDAGSPRFDFARVFGEFILIFAGPAFSLGKQIAERFCPFYYLCRDQRVCTGISRRNGTDRIPCNTAR
jgi:hypothetical protein